jgi:hypothetical protein
MEREKFSRRSVDHVGASRGKKARIGGRWWQGVTQGTYSGLLGGRRCGKMLLVMEW